MPSFLKEVNQRVNDKASEWVERFGVLSIMYQLENRGVEKHLVHEIKTLWPEYIHQKFAFLQVARHPERNYSSPHPVIHEIYTGLELAQWVRRCKDADNVLAPTRALLERAVMPTWLRGEIPKTDLPQTIRNNTLPEKLAFYDVLRLLALERKGKPLTQSQYEHLASFISNNLKGPSYAAADGIRLVELCKLPKRAFSWPEKNMRYARMEGMAAVMESFITHTVEGIADDYDPRHQAAKTFLETLVKKGMPPAYVYQGVGMAGAVRCFVDKRMNVHTWISNLTATREGYPPDHWYHEFVNESTKGFAIAIQSLSPRPIIDDHGRQALVCPIGSAPEWQASTTGYLREAFRIPKSEVDFHPVDAALSAYLLPDVSHVGVTLKVEKEGALFRLFLRLSEGTEYCLSGALALPLTSPENLWVDSIPDYEPTDAEKRSITALLQEVVKKQYVKKYGSLTQPKKRDVVSSQPVPGEPVPQKKEKVKTRPAGMVIRFNPPQEHANGTTETKKPPIVFLAEDKKLFHRIDPVIQQRIEEFVQEFNNRPIQLFEQLVYERTPQGDAAFRFKVGKYRLLAAYDEDRKIYTIYRVDKREDVYRKKS